MTTDYFDCLFPGAVELPAYMIGCFAMDRIGRKKTCAPALLLAGVACMLIIVVPSVRTVCVCHNVNYTKRDANSTNEPNNYC